MSHINKVPRSLSKIIILHLALLLFPSSSSPLSHQDEDRYTLV